ncbi:MAG: hypothetical protein ACXWZK_11800 [Solirubrobacterales bacterium]
MQRQVDVVDRVQLTVLFLVLADMVFKPTSEDTAELVIGGSGPGWRGRRRGHVPSAAERSSGPPDAAGLLQGHPQGK